MSVRKLTECRKRNSAHDKMLKRLISPEDALLLWPIGEIEDRCRVPHPDGDKNHYCTRERGHEGIHADLNPNLSTKLPSDDYLIWS